MITVFRPDSFILRTMSSAPSKNLKWLSRTSRYSACSFLAGGIRASGSPSLAPWATSEACHRPALHSSTWTLCSLSQGVSFMPLRNPEMRAATSTPGMSSVASLPTSTNASSSHLLVSTSVSSMSKKTAFTSELPAILSGPRVPLRAMPNPSPLDPLALPLATTKRFEAPGAAAGGLQGPQSLDLGPTLDLGTKIITSLKCRARVLLCCLLFTPSKSIGVSGVGVGVGVASCTGRKRKTSCAVWFGLVASDLIFAAPSFGLLGDGLGNLFDNRQKNSLPYWGGKGRRSEDNGRPLRRRGEREERATRKNQSLLSSLTHHCPP